MRIGELAGLVGISTRAIRHYHRIGLLPEPARKPNGYREYSLRDAVGLARVRRLTELGLSLDEVRDALAGDTGRDLAEILHIGEKALRQRVSRFREVVASDFREQLGRTVGPNDIIENQRRWKGYRLNPRCVRVFRHDAASAR